MKLTPTWKEVVNHLDAVKQRKVAKAKPAKQPAKAAKSKELVELDSEDEEEQEEVEVPGDEIEDEEMADGDTEQTNGVEGVQQNGDGDVDAEPDAEEESILGD
jgi:cohesin complex subunit SA-1/2